MTEPAADLKRELLALNQRLLDSIQGADWKTYEELCDPSLSAFEPEGRGQLIEGLGFHRYYFELGGASSPKQTAMASPHVRMLGEDAAVISYARLTQRLDPSGSPVTSVTEETRVWQRQGGRWKHVHFHRSTPS